MCQEEREKLEKRKTLFRTIKAAMKEIDWTSATLKTRGKIERKERVRVSSYGKVEEVNKETLREKWRQREWVLIGREKNKRKKN